MKSETITSNFWTKNYFFKSKKRKYFSVKYVSTLCKCLCFMNKRVGIMYYHGLTENKTLVSICECITWNHEWNQWLASCICVSNTLQRKMMSNKTESVSMKREYVHLSAFEHVLFSKKLFICSVTGILTGSSRSV